MFKRMNVFSIVLALCLFASSQVLAEPFEPSPDTIPFAPPIHYPVGQAPRCVTGADFDNDGDIDLAVANESSWTVSILKNYGDGMFEPGVEYPVGNRPFSLVAADFDTDGYHDLAVANSWDSSITVLTNQGDGSFVTDSVYRVGRLPVSVGSADLDGDGDFDLAAGCQWDHVICILENNGYGTFQLTQEFLAICPRSIFLSDLDNDEDYDIASVEVGCSSLPELYIYKNHGNGTFASPDTYRFEGGLSSVFAGDFDMEGDYDLVVANSTEGKIGIFKNNGNGTFQDPIEYNTSAWYPSCVFGTDLDQDGDCDLATANGYPYDVSIFQNNGDGTYQNAVAYPVDAVCPYSVFSADLNGDLDNDLVTANYGSDNVSVFLNRTVIDISDNIWVHLTGSPEIGPGDTLRYTLSFGNISNVEATQCTLSGDFGELKIVAASLPYIPVGDSAAIWDIGTLEAGEFGQIMLALTLPKSYAGHYLREPFQVEIIIITTIGGVILGIVVTNLRNWYLDVNDKHPDIRLSKDAHPKFTPPDAFIWLGCTNWGHGVPCVEPTIEAVIRCTSPQCLLNVSTPKGTVTPAGDRWEIDMPLETLVSPYDWNVPGSISDAGIVLLSLDTDPDCQNEKVYVSAFARYINDNDEPDRYKWDNQILEQKHEIVFPYDPNEIVVYPGLFIKSSQTLDYLVFFENEGSAPAESVRVISEVDTALADQTLFITDTSAVYNAFHRRIDWNFPHINLQPDSSSFVSYSIRAKDSLESGTIIRGDAMIYFDYMPGVPCSVFVTVDALNPISQVDSVIRVAFPDTYEVFWSGYDPTPGSSGIMSYSVYFLMDGGPDSLWVADTAWSEEDTLQTSAIFIADIGHYYCFTSIAMDQVWNIEEPPGAPDACLPFLRGDANADWKVDIADVVYIVNYLFMNGPAPNPLERADCNCDGAVNVADAVYLVNYLFINGPPPPC